LNQVEHHSREETEKEQDRDQDYPGQALAERDIG
jgi:hypothetical protein